MKRNLLAAVALLLCLAANAQWFVGGSFGIATQKTTDDARLTTFSLAPTVGYATDANLTIGAELQYDYSDYNAISNNVLKIGPYVRYNVYSNGSFTAFGEAAVYYEHQSNTGAHANGMDIALRPGIAYNMGAHWQAIARTDLFGYQYLDAGHDQSFNTTGFQLSIRNIQLGIVYNF